MSNAIVWYRRDILGGLTTHGHIHLQQGATSEEDTWRALDYAVKEAIPRKTKHGYDQDQTIWYHMLRVPEEANSKQRLSW